MERKHTIEILATIGKSKKSFNEIKDDARIYPSTLSRRMKELEKTGLLRVIFLRESGVNKIKYELTETGLKLLPKIDSIVKHRREAESEKESLLKSLPPRSA